ncbi:MAG: phospho-sugar mutase [Acidimicrobiia bacterium]|nr:MAG: phospho-sugar mutase [Acidimicrobiia bacterium]
MTDLEAAAERWIAGDPDPSTRAELRTIVDGGDQAELEERMGATLRFGTAGLRGRVEAGSNRMNRATVIRATRGLADYVLVSSSADRGPVVVGRDARPSSSVFMEDAIAVFVAAGLDVVYFADVIPTPLVAYAAKQLGAVAAVVVTASHNPPQDNGYKVYAENAVQIVPPADREISKAIEAVGPAVDVPRSQIVGDHVTEVPETLFEDYLRDMGEVVPSVGGGRSLRIVYTAMHGVGGRYVLAALERFGFTSLHPVAAQLEPDGRFPTVAFPNPEEPGAMDRAHELAAAIDADLVLASDPDTDRLAVSLPEPDGHYRQLTGNQIGCLLAEFILDHGEIEVPIVLNSIVSSPLLAAIAAGHGAVYDQTLTGFKWIWNAALDLEADGRGHFVFGYEEALGFSVGPAVRDKDGISAALAFALLAAEARADGATVWERLGNLFRLHGLWVSTQQAIVRPGADGGAEIAAVMAALATATPDTLAGLPVIAVTDYRRGMEQRPRYLGETPLVAFDLGDAGRALVRPSGTEPKLKIYVDLRSDAGDDWRAAEERLSESAKAVAADLVEFLGF